MSNPVWSALDSWKSTYDTSTSQPTPTPTPPKGGNK